MSEFVINNLIKTAAVPLAAAAIAVLLLSLVPDRFRGGGGWIAGVGMLLGFAAGFFLIAGFSGFPPIKIADWLPYAAAFVLLAVWALQRLRFPLRFLFTVGIVGCLLWLYLRPVAANRETGELLVTAAILGALWLLLWWVWAWSNESRGPVPESLLVMAVAGTAASMVTVLDGSALLGQLGGVLAASCGGIFLVRMFRPNLVMGPMPNAVFLSLFGGLLIVAHLYAEVSSLGLSLAFISALAVIPCGFSRFRDLGAVKRGLIAVALAALPAAIAIIYLVRNATHDDYGY